MASWNDHEDRCSCIACSDLGAALESQIPTIFESPKIIVRHNPSGEIFVASKQTKAEVRISPDRYSMRITVQNARLTPTAHNGLSGFIVEPINF